MKNSRMKFVPLLMAFTLSLSGCGTANYNLSPEEEAIVVSYAARVVVKHTANQAEGSVNVSDGMEADTEEAVKNEPETKAEAEPSPNSQPEAVSQEPQVQEGMTFNQVFGMGDVTADYVGAQLSEDYKSQDYYSMNAEAGKQFVVLNMKLTNHAQQAMHVDMLAAKPVFSLTVNGSKATPSKTTILLNDFSTYQGDLQAGETQDTVLLFEIPIEGTQEITSLELKTTVNGQSYNIIL